MPESPRDDSWVDQHYHAAIWSWFLDSGHADGTYGYDSEKTAHLKACGVDLARSGTPDIESIGVFDSFDSHASSAGVSALATCRCRRYGRGSRGGSIYWIDTCADLSEMIKAVISYSPESRLG